MEDSAGSNAAMHAVHAGSPAVSILLRRHSKAARSEEKRASFLPLAHANDHADHTIRDYDRAILRAEEAMRSLLDEEADACIHTCSLVKGLTKSTGFATTKARGASTCGGLAESGGSKAGGGGSIRRGRSRGAGKSSRTVGTTSNAAGSSRGVTLASTQSDEENSMIIADEGNHPVSSARWLKPGSWAWLCLTDISLDQICGCDRGQDADTTGHRRRAGEGSRVAGVIMR
eukprot:CAMPEP_0183371756 /NCGR_PEP_ID=MMETSP0164_2-20130417/106348_1 /TAXON_ID=221442 /ORGANISM="Coccolithus pelagicus ssp braarudi, Strain PLY182g" /LENGTH=229 /DNA_ID=CAMNT_0025548355 /DNA_START=14 /DNA_END=705 /DNA_ORIENTATION=+